MKENNCSLFREANETRKLILYEELSYWSEVVHLLTIDIQSGKCSAAMQYHFSCHHIPNMRIHTWELFSFSVVDNIRTFILWNFRDCFLFLFTKSNVFVEEQLTLTWKALGSNPVADTFASIKLHGRCGYRPQSKAVQYSGFKYLTHWRRVVLQQLVIRWASYWDHNILWNWKVQCLLNNSLPRMSILKAKSVLVHTMQVLRWRRDIAPTHVRPLH